MLSPLEWQRFGHATSTSELHDNLVSTLQKPDKPQNGRAASALQPPVIQKAGFSARTGYAAIFGDRKLDAGRCFYIYWTRVTG